MKKIQKIVGSAMLEFILIIPIFLGLFAGLIDTSILIYDKIIITQASREGARFGVVVRSGGYAELSDVQAHTINYCYDKLMSFGGSPSVTVTVTQSASENPVFGDLLSVTVDYPFNGLIQQTNITSTTVMSYE